MRRDPRSIDNGPRDFQRDLNRTVPLPIRSFTSNAQRARALGLAIVKKIGGKNTAGRIEADITTLGGPPAGAKFSIYLPLGDGAALRGFGSRAHR